MIKRDWSTSSNFVNYSTLNSQCNWRGEDLMRNQHINTNALPITMKRGINVNPIFVDISS